MIILNKLNPGNLAFKICGIPRFHKKTSIITKNNWLNDLHFR